MGEPSLRKSRGKTPLRGGGARNKAVLRAAPPRRSPLVPTLVAFGYYLSVAMTAPALPSMCNEIVSGDANSVTPEVQELQRRQPVRYFQYCRPAVHVPLRADLGVAERLLWEETLPAAELPGLGPRMGHCVSLPLAADPAAGPGLGWGQ
eukprot:scaffold1130_cov195-Pinguiococcus_pyrenoidosus.AAC.46